MQNNNVSKSPDVTSNVSHNNMVTQTNLSHSNLTTSRVQVPETCLKEVLPCKVSPLGFHLSAMIKREKLGGANSWTCCLFSFQEKNLHLLKNQRTNKMMKDVDLLLGPFSEKHPELCAGLF